MKQAFQNKFDYNCSIAGKSFAFYSLHIEMSSESKPIAVVKTHKKLIKAQTTVTVAVVAQWYLSESSISQVASWRRAS